MASLKLLRWLFSGILAVFYFPSFASELVADPTWQTGKLANGFSWQILATPQRSTDNVEIRLVIRTGSLNESGSQTGYNHLLTKIALAASAEGNAAELPVLWQPTQENTLKLPPAISSYEFTQFNFSLPVNKPILIKDALRWLSITAGELPINADIIQSALVAPEHTVSFPADTQDSVWQFRIKDSGLVNHDPLAVPNSPVDRDKLLAFYQQWFTPDAMTLYVVGNVESRSVIESINKNFSKLTGKREKPAQMAILAPLAHKTAYLTNQAYASPRLAVIWDMPWSPIQDSESLHHYWLRELVREAVLLRLNGTLDGTVVDKNMVCHAFYQRDYCELNLPVDTKAAAEGQNGMLDATSSLITNGLTEAEYQQLMNVQSDRLAAVYLTYAHLSTRNLIERRLIFRRNNVADIAPEQFQKLRKTFLNSLTLATMNQAILQQLAQPASFLLMQQNDQPVVNLEKLQAKLEKKISDHLASLNQEQEQKQKHSNAQQ
jgi:zinc protease